MPTTSQGSTRPSYGGYFFVWRIPDRLMDAGNGSRFMSEEVMIYYRTNLRKGEPFTTMIQKFGGDPRWFTKTI
jgi:hypothetical protein